MFFHSKKYELNTDINVSQPKAFTAENTKLKYRFPNVVDSRDLCLPTNNQGKTPHCVGFSVAAYLEVEYWKQFHYPVQFPADKIYEEAKKIDPSKEDGTTIEYGFDGAKRLKLFDGEIKTFEPWTSNVRFQLHKYGIFCGAFLVTNEWYDVSRRSGIISTKRRPKVLGGHAVLVCGYNEDGIFIQNSWGYEEWGKYGFAILPWNLVVQQLVYGVVIDNIKMKLFENETVVPNASE